MLKEIVQEISEGKHDSDADMQFMKLNKIAVDLHNQIKKAKGKKKKDLEDELASLEPMLRAMQQRTTQW